MKNLFIILALFISTPAFADTTYVIWPDSVDAEFRSAYQAEVGEVIQNPPQASVNGKNLVGSHRVTPEQADALTVEFPEALFTQEVPEEFRGGEG